MRTLQLIKSPPAFGLPASDVASIEAELFLIHVSKKAKEAGSDHTVEVIENPYCSNGLAPVPGRRTQSVPIFVDSGVSSISSDSIPHYLLQKVANLNNNLSRDVIADINAYHAIFEKVYHAINYLSIVDSNEMPYAQNVNVFFRYLLRDRHYRDILTISDAMDIRNRNDALYLIASSFYDISIKLNEKKYIFGELSTLDITVASAVLFLYFGNTRCESMLELFFPNLLIFAYNIVKESNIENFTASLPVDRVTEEDAKKVVQIMNITDKNELRLSLTQLTGMSVGKLDHDYALQAITTSQIIHEKENTLIKDRVVVTNPATVFTNPFALACVGSMAAYFLLIKSFGVFKK